ncbi:hypothetical protein DPMN_039247 [Dreissena polymorpha]|uniref:Uncharacterized protein n=1 Tax=Dreissena polymorpha TaxID=45954 RepID=A0A9D4RR49_DREPO|nr:hypothetical protein DPMN_039247 [Dreissena polymorpha]
MWSTWYTLPRRDVSTAVMWSTWYTVPRCDVSCETQVRKGLPGDRTCDLEFWHQCYNLTTDLLHYELLF